ncbi:MAG: PqqD family protein [bacterium]|nr:PqqD family protein [bacterium]
MNAQLQHTDRYEGRDLGDEYLFFDAEGMQYFVLNATARSIYLLCDGTRSEDDVIREFGEMYELDAETAGRDGRDTVRELLDRGLLSPP